MPYISNTDRDRQKMFARIGISKFEDLIQAIPEKFRLDGELKLDKAMSELEITHKIKSQTCKNLCTQSTNSFLGAGVYDHFIPAAVDSIVSRPEFFTAYTPYQAEVSQGTLQYIYEYQTMICELTGMEVSNASVYDGAVALAEAVSMACSATNRSEVLLARTVHPEAREVVKTYSRFDGAEIIELGYDQNGVTCLQEAEELVNDRTGAIVLQSPNFFGCLEALNRFAELAHRHKALFIVSADPISLGLLQSPGEAGADIVVGEGQGLGNPLSFGGPYFGFMATTERLMRRLPGRIVGQTTDGDGKRGFILTLQAREQHIRRGKATSNICSNQSLCALAATIYLTVLGKAGLKRVAELCLQKAHYACELLVETGKFSPAFGAPFFKEFVVIAREDAASLNARLLEQKLIGGYPLSGDYPELGNALLIAVTEKRTRAEIDRLVEYSKGQNP